MYQYSHQIQEVKSPINALENQDMFLLLDRFPNTGNYSTQFHSISENENTAQQPISTTSSANVSPYMSGKEECSEQQQEIEDPESPSNYQSKSGKSLQNKAERRAEHNAIERARRECLNSKFQQLAEALPNLQNHRRPSKGQIVEKALDWVKQNISKEDRYQYQIMQLQNENKRLLSQIAHESSRSSSGVVTPPMPSTASPGSFSSNLNLNPFPGSSSSSRKNSMVINPYFNQPEEMSTMYSMTSLGVEWQNQASSFLNQSDFNGTIPSPSSSTHLLRKDDQKTHLSHCNNFEMDNNVSPVAPWSKVQMLSFPMNNETSSNCNNTNYPYLT